VAAPVRPGNQDPIERLLGDNYTADDEGTVAAGLPRAREKAHRGLLSVRTRLDLAC